MSALLARLARRFFPALTRAVVVGRALAFAHGQARGTTTNAAGDPIPWYTYPALEYLSQFDARELSVFEFGAGSSSLFWAARARRVCAVESDPAWHARLAAEHARNLDIALREDKAGYVGHLAALAEKFDIIVIDGRWRRSCAAAAPAGLREGGMIVLDNADWYPDTARGLREAGFLQIDFSGFGPINAYAWTTSVFVRGTTALQRGFHHPAPIGGYPHHGAEDD